ncbi:MAG: hypothetical protein IPK39_15660 [Sulfuritalea sp.]|nr:hypothetical protein [Sulfuritalea sp.]
MTFPSGGTGTLTVNTGGKVKAGSLTVWNGSSSIKTGTTASTTGGIIDIAGALTLQGGGKVTGYYGFVGDPDANFTNSLYARGGATITGSGSEWITHDVRVGHTGTATLTVSASGKVTSSANLEVGTYFNSNGTLNITAGGFVDTDGNGYLGVFNGATGAATVGGAGALWDVGGGLYVGGNNVSSGGTSTLTVNSGGTVKAGSLTVWNSASSITTGTTASPTGGIIDIAGALTLQGGGKATGHNGYVDGSYTDTLSGIYADSATIGGIGFGSRWDTGNLYTGRNGTGTLNVNSGGTVKSTGATYVGLTSGANGTLNINADGFVDTDSNGYLGFGLGATGAATVGGTGARWDTTTLYTGYNGTGTLTVNSGGTVKSTGDTYVGRNSGANGTLNINADGFRTRVATGSWDSFRAQLAKPRWAARARCGM